VKSTHHTGEKRKKGPRWKTLAKGLIHKAKRGIVPKKLPGSSPDITKEGRESWPRKEEVQLKKGEKEGIIPPKKTCSLGNVEQKRSKALLPE